MASFWRRHRRIRILSYTVLALLFLVCILPYLIPLGEAKGQTPADELVSEHGQFLDIKGVRIYVEDQNTRSEQATIVLIHGLGSSTFSWRHNAPFFASQGYRVVALDMKGFGLSHKDFVSDYSHPEQARLLAKVFTGLGIERAYLVGHSMGTSVMLHFAHLYPDKVLGLVSVGGFVSLDGGSTFPSALLHFPPLRRAGEVLLTRLGTKERIGRILASAYHQGIVTPEAVDGYYSRLVAGAWAQSLLAMTRDMPRNRIRFDLADLKFPTLILWGESDTWVKRNDVDRWRAQMMSAEFHAVPDAGHLLMEEQPELFNSMVLAFVQSCTG